jgi:GNAT superfamily N-acetyltransferase
MEFDIINLNRDEVEEIESRLEKYDLNKIGYKISGQINLGVKLNSKLIAGINASVTAYKILYVSTVFVDIKYRGKGFGKRLMEELEKRAIGLDINTICLDTFNWQGYEFYLKMGYELIGSYRNETDDFSEYFFIKRL